MVKLVVQHVSIIIFTSKPALACIPSYDLIYSNFILERACSSCIAGGDWGA